jgi:hypothetical protein
MGKFLLTVVGGLIGLIIVGALAMWLVHALIGVIGYIIVGALVIGGGVWIYNRAKRAVGPGTRNRNRIDAAYKTYKQR